MSKNPMEKCEMLEAGRTYVFNLSGEMRRQTYDASGYLPRIKAVLCPREECPYNNALLNREGELIRLFDGTAVLKLICTSDGLVKKAGLLEVKKKSKRKIDRTKRRAY